MISKPEGVVDKVGLRVGDWQILAFAGQRPCGAALWLSVCVCGTFRVCSPGPSSLSCGCRRIQRTREVIGTHLASRSKLYYIYYAMLERCRNPNNKKYAYYGGRGVSVCARWDKERGGSFKNFKMDMGDPPAGLTLERKDVNKDYSPDNCEWADYGKQNYNQRKKASNTSGRTGVSWRPAKGKWRARISFNGDEICLGHFLSFEEAVAARQTAELNYYGFIKE